VNNRRQNHADTNSQFLLRPFAIEVRENFRDADNRRIFPQLSQDIFEMSGSRRY